MSDRFTIVGIGEALWDIYPDEQRAGGAPLNVAVHAHRLAQVRQGRGVLVSRVGQDDLGEALLRDLRERGLNVDYIQTDPDRTTGRVYIDFNREGQPRFEIMPDAAWDVIQYDFDLEDLAQRCGAICFGSLAQRDAQSRSTIYRFVDAARRSVRLFDVNLRQKYFEHSSIHRSMEMATLVKVNEEELVQVSRLLGLEAPTGSDPQALDEQARALRERYELEMVALTRGPLGTRLFTADEQVDGEPTHYEPAADADPIGAGDAAAAGVLVGRMLRLPLQRVADLANHCGAFVASQPGATPVLPDSILAMVRA